MDRPDCYRSGYIVHLANLDADVGSGLPEPYRIRFVGVTAISARGYDETHKATGLTSMAWRQDAAAVMPAMTITAQPLIRLECRFAAPERGAQNP